VDGEIEVHRLAVLQEPVRLGGGGRGLAAVVGLQLLGAFVPVDEECASAETRRLRLDQAEHELGGDGRVDRRAAGAQHLAARFGGERARGRDHERLRYGKRLFRAPAAGFGFELKARKRALPGTRPLQSRRGEQQGEYGERRS
jgi:hypothetical protein